LGVQTSEAISAAIFDSEQTIEKLMHDREARSDLARGLMGRFHEFGKETIKGGRRRRYGEPAGRQRCAEGAEHRQSDGKRCCDSL